MQACSGSFRRAWRTTRQPGSFTACSPETLAMAAIPSIPEYAELRCVSNFSFLRGASQPEELVERAKQLGYTALAITDECSMSGIVRAHTAAKQHQLKLLVGSQFRVEWGTRWRRPTRRPSTSRCWPATCAATATFANSSPSCGVRPRRAPTTSTSRTSPATNSPTAWCWHRPKRMSEPAQLDDSRQVAA